MKRAIAAAVILSTLGGSFALAQGKVPFPVKARQGQMATMAMSLGVLGGMAQGKTEYDAAAAQAAANNLAGIAMIDPAIMWQDGTAEGTASLPAIWDDADGFAAEWAKFVAGAEKAAAEAGNGKDALGPILGALGGSCKSCHTAYRAN